MQFLVEEALVMRHELEQTEETLQAQQKQAVAAAEARVAADLNRIQGRVQ